MLKMIAFAAAGALLLPATTSAHHAFSAEFDANSPVLLKGEVTRIEWVNPHAWVHLKVEDEDGNSQQWMVEGGTPNTLFRNGIDQQSLVAGTEIVVRGYQSKDFLCAPA